jgi:hypothetical protein
MLYKRRICLKWTSIIIAYLCIFLLSYEYGISIRQVDVEEESIEPQHLTIKRLFHDHGEYLNSSEILKMIKLELAYSFSFDTYSANNEASMTRHALVVFYDYTYHHLLFQQFLWLYSSWCQLHSHTSIQNDLIVFISYPIIPNEFLKLENLTTTIKTNKNRLFIYPCLTLIDSILNKHYEYLNDFSLHLNMELGRLFYWQQTRLSSLLLFLIDEYKDKLFNYDYIFRLDVDSFLMPNFASYQQTSSLILGESIPSDQYTSNRLDRIQNYFSIKSKNQINKQTITISWFGRLNLLTRLTRQIILMSLWLIKEEFTDSERVHHLTYLNYPSWYIDGIFEYATAIILSLNQYEKYSHRILHQFDCHHSLTNCLHISFRDPSHHLHLSKHSLHSLTKINQSNLTNNELYIYQTVIKSNGMFRLNFL